ncbi:alpha/beta fold hydrolase [Ruegeria atlantica]|uniref:Pimelyl-[acyl-carrier protein] methyl ester esterase n=1 Tax=Ruegeria atlantica TaxID=81569 RepID=A0A0P1EA48_9RHOB|nr:alpha/beta hydrolase [Ruegeria atlantica]CUH45619.1 Pimelyl-[acyl-carrier protein] methyl ester esterase [Ruegeria atlantica]
MRDTPLADNTFVRTLGQGAREVLALHCTIAHSGAWSGLATALEGEATFTAPDMPSHGRSADWDGHGDLFDQVTQLSAAHLTEPMDVIGHSFGGMLALRLAVEFPDLVRSAVLIEPVFFAVAIQDTPDLVRQHDEEAKPVSDALAAGNFEQAARLFNRMWGAQDGPRWPELPERTRAGMIRGIHVVPAFDDALFLDQKGMLNPGVLDRASMPVLILSGSETHPVMPAIGEGLARRLPNAGTGVVSGADHMVPITHPVQTAAVIRKFWGGLS